MEESYIADYKMQIKSILVFVFLGLILGIALSQIYNENTKSSYNLKNETLQNKTIIGKNNIPDLCYSTLQPSPYFTKSRNLFGIEGDSVRIDNLNKMVTIDNPLGYEMSKIYVKPTGSMRPAIADLSTLILVKPERISDIKVGDIVFAKDAGFIFPNTDDYIHRVVEITSDGRYITKGDNNHEVDVAISFQDIKYKVVAIIY